MASRLLPRALAPLLLLLSAAASPAAEATLHPVDYLALQAVRRALTDLPGSRFFASWDFTGDPCLFVGVSCSPNGRVTTLPALTSLSLVPGRVTGTLSPAVTSLPALCFVALTGNLLSGDLPAAFAPALRTVDLSKNGFTGRVPASLLQLWDLHGEILL